MRRSISIGRANKIQLTNQLFRPIILLTNRGRIARESGPTSFLWSCQLLCLLTGGLTRLRQRDLIYMEIDTGMMVFGKDALADSTGLIDSAFGEQDYCLTEFGIRTFRDKERCLQMGAQLVLHRLYLDLDASLSGS